MDDGMTGEYARRVGQRLRMVRRQQGHSLQGVEAASGQEFKASVLGAYERGERAVSVPRLQRLARLYSVPVDQLLPRDPEERTEWGNDHASAPAAKEDRSKVTIDLARLEASTSEDARLLRRYLRMIQVLRQDFNGRVLTVREDDLRAMSCLIAVPPSMMRQRLEELASPLTRAAGDVSSWLVPSSSSPYGVYVHIPFCSRRCDYCAFATWTDRSELMPAYASACRAELRRLQESEKAPPPATSVFFGGGTPSLLPAVELVGILEAIDRSPGAEVTVECNPETVDRAKLAAYRAGGVTRLSFGVQSMSAAVLRALGREHDPAAVYRAVDAAADAGFAGHYSVDLIYGGAGETAGDWRQTLHDVLALDPAPAHVSAYALTVEPGTPLAADASRHPDDDDQADKYVLADQLLGEAGLEWYEVSNWARPGAECDHNQLYWSQGEYRGIGCAAHSHALTADGGARRWWNLRTPGRYIRAVEHGASVEAAGEDLDAGTRRLEAAQLALRTRAGVHAALLPDDPVLEGLVERRDGRAVLTRHGRLLANEVSLHLEAGAK